MHGNESFQLKTEGWDVVSGGKERDTLEPRRTSHISPKPEL